MSRRGLALALVLIIPIVARAAILAFSSPPDLAEGLPLTEPEKQGLELSGGRLRHSQEFRYAAKLLAGGYVKMRCLPSDAARAEPYIVCVQTLTADATGLDAARDSLQVWR
jgi:hypothetical protein